MDASNRQKKILRFFNIPFASGISAGAAGWEIGTLMHDEQNGESWRKYVFLTNDFDSDSDLLKPFDPMDLAAVVIPDDWKHTAAIAAFREELVAAEMSDNSPFDSPQPQVQFTGRVFMFTGNFEFGSRTACQAVVVQQDGKAPSTKSITPEIDYLVVGAKGSKTWKRDSYGNKIEDAILSRRRNGSPAIISEEHWMECLRCAWKSQTNPS